ncbi:glycosyltransferase family 4 protein [Micrococcus terreus]|uniref:D-inositol 3-phosphate glycosyltransferase n=1 Tax=Micrococcus terreus TaxID=574650 RepID=A0A1I7ME15_9MICC|nr:glycosyltransferase family 4 protein [Micrococcus terreus]SFV20182.1 hypothetical protein SAMN04487966_101199 [Micrococcus terreus]
MSHMANAGSVLFGMTIDYQLRYHQGLWQRLNAARWNVHLACSPGTNLAAETAPGVHLHEVSMSREPDPLNDLVALMRWRKLFREVKPDVVVLGTPKASLLGLAAASMTGVPNRIYEVHGLRLEGSRGWKRKLLAWMERLTCRLATTVVPVGESLSNQLVRLQLCDPKKIRVLGFGSPNGVDLEHFKAARENRVAQACLRKSLRIASDRPVITFIGRLNNDKGLNCLARAVARLDPSLNVQLLIVGGTEESSEADLETLRAATNSVTFAGEVTDVAPYLAITDVLCLPSRREGLPTVVLEAFATSVPVVATRATGIVDLVEHRLTGGLADIDDDVALADELRIVLSEANVAERYASNALAMVTARYRRSEVQDRWVEFLRLMQHPRR